MDCVNVGLYCALKESSVIFACLHHDGEISELCCPVVYVEPPYILRNYEPYCLPYAVAASAVYLNENVEHCREDMP